MWTQQNVFCMICLSFMEQNPSTTQFERIKADHQCWLSICLCFTAFEQKFMFCTFTNKYLTIKLYFLFLWLLCTLVLFRALVLWCHMIVKIKTSQNIYLESFLWLQYIVCKGTCQDIKRASEALSVQFWSKNKKVFYNLLFIFSDFINFMFTTPVALFY